MITAHFKPDTFYTIRVAGVDYLCIPRDYARREMDIDILLENQHTDSADIDTELVFHPSLETGPVPVAFLTGVPPDMKIQDTVNPYWLDPVNKNEEIGYLIELTKYNLPIKGRATTNKNRLWSVIHKHLTDSQTDADS